MRAERVSTLRSGACGAGSRPNGAEADEVPGDRHSARTGEVPRIDTVPGQASAGDRHRRDAEERHSARTGDEVALI